jgi:hypothetical protein
VINVILKRDYRGADLSLTSGLTGRGDGAYGRIEGRVGFTPDHGATDVMIAVSHTQSTGLKARDRDTQANGQALIFADNPANFFTGFSAPILGGVTVATFRTGANLSLKGAPAGVSLGSTFTYLPLGFAGSDAQSRALLAANAGTLNLGLSPDAWGAAGSLTANTKTSALLASARRRFGESMEGFVDLIALQNDGRIVFGYTPTTANSLVSALAPNNPFQQDVVVSTPHPGFDGVDTNRIGAVRATVGLIVDLPRTWRAEIAYSFGGSRQVADSNGWTLNSDFSAALNLDQPGANGEPAPNPFGDWTRYVAAIQAYRSPTHSHLDLVNDFQDAHLRLAGPVFSTPAGDIVLSLLAERLREASPSIDIGALVLPAFSQTISSLYAEVRAPILAGGSGPWPLKGLEVRLAARYDAETPRFGALTVGALETLSLARVGRAAEAATAYTAGLRAFPTERLMVRASVATGVLPPTASQLLQADISVPVSLLTGPPDPQRGGRLLGSEGPLEVLLNGSPHLRPERGRTLAVGFVLNPEGEGRPRLSIDLSHFDLRDEISNAHNADLAYFVAHESLYPGRVVRAPLTAADIAAGFTGGVITRIDTTFLNIGKTSMDAVDMRADYQIALRGGDRLRLYGVATWQPRLQRRQAPDVPAIDYIGFNDGPLRWRGNAGVDWTHGALSLGLNAQYYASYYDIEAERVTSAGTAPFNLPGVHIPAQLYVDLSLAYRLRLPAGAGPVRDLDLRLGVKDLFDRMPPSATSSFIGYSAYGDPRGRRFEVSATAHF